MEIRVQKLIDKRCWYDWIQRTSCGTLTVKEYDSGATIYSGNGESLQEEIVDLGGDSDGDSEVVVVEEIAGTTLLQLSTHDSGTDYLSPFHVNAYSQP